MTLWWVLWPALVGATAESPAETVSAYVDAYNRRDLNALSERADEGVAWLSIEGQQVVVQTESRDALMQALQGYFDSCSSCRSTIEILGTVGPYVSVRETAHWESRQVARSQSSLSVYEVHQGRVLRVWYFPAVQE